MELYNSIRHLQIDKLNVCVCLMGHKFVVFGVMHDIFVIFCQTFCHYNLLIRFLTTYAARENHCDPLPNMFLFK